MEGRIWCMATVYAPLCLLSLPFSCLCQAPTGILRSRLENQKSKQITRIFYIWDSSLTEECFHCLVINKPYFSSAPAIITISKSIFLGSWGEKRLINKVMYAGYMLAMNLHHIQFSYKQWLMFLHITHNCFKINNCSLFYLWGSFGDYPLLSFLHQ